MHFNHCKFNHKKDNEDTYQQLRRETLNLLFRMSVHGIPVLHQNRTQYQRTIFQKKGRK